MLEGDLGVEDEEDMEVRVERVCANLVGTHSCVLLLMYIYYTFSLIVRFWLTRSGVFC